MEKRSRLLVAILQVAFYLNFLEAISKGGRKPGATTTPPIRGMRTSTPPPADCSSINGTCAANETCVTTNFTLGSVGRCQCSPGFQRTSSSDKCIDIDECQLRRCDSQTTTCINTIGSFHCNCKDGYFGSNGSFCKDIDECRLHPCDTRTTTACNNTMGSFVCNCKNGYKPGNNKTVCEDIDECQLRRCDSQTTTCINTIGSFRCSCKNGYFRNNWTVCKDIDECKLSRCDTQTTTCTNTAGSFFCKCKNGYKVGSTGRFCEDINECNLGQCDNQTTTCANTMGSFVCYCKNGYTSGNSKTVCEDIDECSLRYCDTQTTTCTNTMGNYACNCKNGYKPGSSKTFCEDIDECSLRYCDTQTTTCTNAMGSFVCNCRNGYKRGNNKTFCEDKDECSLRQCDSQTTTCTNNIGSYVCNCKNGYRPGRRNTVCGDIDECNLRHCDNQTTTCSNTMGSFSCNCRKGYKPGDNKTFCEDIDECNLRHCDSQTTTCTNTMGSYFCNCKHGYKHGSNKTSCEDIDECKIGLCDKQTTICTNNIGSFVCNCNNGYMPGGNKTLCEDIDECKIGVCDKQTTTCTNNMGSFVCNCNNGYKPGMNKTFCEDVDECETMNDTCVNETQLCNNTVGSYVCTCKNGFQMINKSHVNKCEAISMPKYDINTGISAGAAVGLVLVFALIAAIVLPMLHAARRRKLERLVNRRPNQELQELPNSSQGNQPRNRTLNTKDPNVYEEIQPTTGNALTTLRIKLSNPDRLKQEFKSVALQQKEFCALGIRDDAKKKNRFINIIPYESNRVVLPGTSEEHSSQYINASYVQGYDNTTKFIATQGPREETLEDFWRMVFENRVQLIVMITNLVEREKKKCEKYWPDLGHPVVYGDITVTLSSEESWPDYTVRSLRYSKKSRSVELTQFHYLSWPDHDIPSDIKGFLTFHRIVRQQMKPDEYTVVHCSAGAGRTGAFIAIDYLLDQEKVEHNVRILDCLKNLRDQRSHMIQNLEQYVFVHNALLFAFEIGDTSIPTKHFLSKYKELQTKDAASGISALEKQYQFIERVQIEPKETEKYRVGSNVVAQKKMKAMNAVFVQNRKLKEAYIVTQPADHFTTSWKLCREKNCDVMIFLDPFSALGNSFLPTKDNPKTLSDCTILCESMTKEDYGSRYAVVEMKELEDTTYANVNSSHIYQNTGSILTKTRVTVLHVIEFAGKGSWDVNRLMSLYHVVSKLTSEKTEVPMMAVSSDCSLSGFCLAAFNAFEMMKQEEMVDLYQIVLNIRKSRAELFTSLSAYIDLHSVVERYVALPN